MVYGGDRGIGPRGYRVGEYTRLAMANDFFRPLTGMYGVMELQPGQVNWGTVNPQPFPGAVRLWLWHVFAGGSKFTCTYRYRAPLYGFEAYHYGIVGTDGVTPTPGRKGVRAVHRRDSAAASEGRPRGSRPRRLRPADDRDPDRHGQRPGDQPEQTDDRVEHRGARPEVLPGAEVVRRSGGLRSRRRGLRPLPGARGAGLPDDRRGADRQADAVRGARRHARPDVQDGPSGSQGPPVGGEILPADVEVDRRGDRVLRPADAPRPQQRQDRFTGLRVEQLGRSPEALARAPRPGRPTRATSTPGRPPSSRGDWARERSPGSAWTPGRGSSRSRSWRGLFEQRGIAIEHYPEGVLVEYRDGLGIGVNYSDKDYEMPLPEGAEVLIGSRILKTAGVLVWKVAR